MHQTTIRVRYAETDQMGVVYYANYYVWMEVGRGEFVRSLGIDYREVEEKDGLLLAVVESKCRYVSPARYDQEVAIQTRLSFANSSMVEFSYEIAEAGLERTLARGSTKHIWVDREFRIARLPDHYLEILKSSVERKS